MTFDELLERARSFQESRVLLTAIELDVFEAVGGGTSAAEVAAGIGADVRATEMLLDALAALEIVRKKDGVYSNTPFSQRYLVAGGRDDRRAALLHSAHLWGRWSTLTECVRRGRAVIPREAGDHSDEWTSAFIAAMHHNAAARAPLVVRAVGAGEARRMLDVGGGSGAYSIAFARANQDLRVELLDVPAVLPIARRHIEEAGLSERRTTRAGDLRSDDLGSGFDLILVSAICDMLGPEANQDLLGRCFAALSPGGRLVIQDFILSPDRTSPRSGALFALNMLVGTQEGRTYTNEEYESWLSRAGFSDVEHLPLPGPTGLMIGRRP
jgi:predicted O-methyltransferase YrrM